MQHIKFLLPVLFTFFIISCATVEDHFDEKWKGKTAASMIKKNGEPDEIKEGDNGEKILVYYVQQTSKLGYAKATKPTSNRAQQIKNEQKLNNPKTYSYTLNYYVNSNDRIYKVTQTP
ncbi:hypothetical protein LY01_02482 [Nonlabens xylanidelens]|uniref:Lipoprotein n=1 Tax=Nonlabens xylanidelens TaxID=191564 RepID=A0A2S6IHL7_9FLAO|nr:hypothetical protein [Nonlabens xylanidelens]PPK93698.1 hypothetical protein LY01_02482 [Nonlabens xylanidelens]PQJ17726.1 hypothetical protein BST94_11855 [Nonlabens xylanidelens]